jgi:hypothetical protein
VSEDGVLNLNTINVSQTSGRRLYANTSSTKNDMLNISNNIIYNGEPQIFDYNKDYNLSTNKTIINFEYEDVNVKKLITPLHLLKLNTGESYPFANRLLEYLIGNAITPLDAIGDNIERVKTAVNKKLGAPYKFAQDGLWDDKLKLQFYSYITSLPSTLEINHDILGYVDKDIESHYSYISKVTRYKNGYKIGELDAETANKVLMYKNGYKFSEQEAEKLKRIINELEIDIRTISSTNIYDDKEWED